MLDKLIFGLPFFLIFPISAFTVSGLALFPFLMSILISIRYIIFKKEDKDAFCVEKETPAPLVIMTILLFTYCAISVTWSGLDSHEFKRNLISCAVYFSGILFGILGTHLVRNIKVKSIVFDFIYTGIVLSSIIIIIDTGILDSKLIITYLGSKNHYFSDAAVKMHKGQLFIITALWPILAYNIMNKRVLKAAFLLTITLIACFSTFVFRKLNYAVLASAVGSALVFFTYFITKKNLKNLSIFGFIFLISLFPAIFAFAPKSKIHSMPNIKTSFEHRVCIWDYYMSIVKEKPLFGHGFYYSRNINQKDTETLCSSIVSTPHNPELSALRAAATHPHNISIQILLEIGLLGMLVFVYFGIRAIEMIHADDSIIIRKKTIKYINNKVIINGAYMASFFSFIIFMLASSNIWSTWVCGLVSAVTIIFSLLHNKHIE